MEQLKHSEEEILNLGREISTHYEHPFRFVEVFKIKDQLRKVCDHNWEYVRNGDPGGRTLWYCQKCGNWR